MTIQRNLLAAALLGLLTSVAFGFAGGDGSSGSPFQIATADHLNDIRNDLGAYYVLINDIDLDVAPYNTGEGWEPIGESTNRFTGQLDGAGFEIRNLFIDRPEGSEIAFFAFTANAGFDPGATIINLDVVDADVTASSFSAVLVGNAREGVHISNVSITATFEIANSIGACMVAQAWANSLIEDSWIDCIMVMASGSRLGGMVGELKGQAIIARSWSAGSINTSGNRSGGLVGETEDQAMIIDSHSSVDVNSSSSRAGGLVGQVSNDTIIINSYATGDVLTTTGRAGGLASRLRQNSQVINSWASGNVTAEERAGGLVGYAEGSSSIVQSYATGHATSTHERSGGLVGSLEGEASIQDSYAWGGASGDNEVGGLVGHADADTSIITSYATGPVIDVSNAGGLVGLAAAGASITDSYWDRESTGQQSSSGQTDDFGLTTAEMQGGAAVENMAGFDFEDVWFEVPGYPVLGWQPPQFEPMPTPMPVPVNAPWTLIVLSLALLLLVGVKRRRTNSPLH